MAQAAGLPLGGEELDRVLAPLEALAPLFARMADRVAHETDPAVIFDANGETAA